MRIDRLAQICCHALADPGNEKEARGAGRAKQWQQLIKQENSCLLNPHHRAKPVINHKRTAIGMASVASVAITSAMRAPAIIPGYFRIKAKRQKRLTERLRGQRLASSSCWATISAEVLRLTVSS